MKLGQLKFALLAGVAVMAISTGAIAAEKVVSTSKTTVTRTSSVDGNTEIRAEETTARSLNQVEAAAGEGITYGSDSATRTGRSLNDDDNTDDATPGQATTGTPMFDSNRSSSY